MIGQGALRTAIAVAAFHLPQPATASAAAEVCAENGADGSYFFAVEAAQGSRETAVLEPGQQICASGGAAGDRAVVSVFPDAEHLEGCSRLTPMGQTEVLIRYVDFDRCEWASQKK
ncbi:hypothetical protein ACUXV3_04490 [Roseobacteraceae bacterium NS-SX3]